MPTILTLPTLSIPDRHYLVSLAHCMGAEAGTDPILKSMQTIGKPGANATKNGLDDDGILA